MNAPVNFKPRRAESCPPAQYLAYITSARRFVESRGLFWDVSLDEQGRVPPSAAWDLRSLTGGHAKYAVRLTDFSVDKETRAKALAAGFPDALVPPEGPLPDDSRDFLKAVVAHRCRERKGESLTQGHARYVRRLLSTAACPPWELSRADLERFIDLLQPSASCVEALMSLAQVVDENFLSNAVPIRPEARTVSRYVMDGPDKARQTQEKLPDKEAFLELARIVAQEKPRDDRDALVFAAFRLMMLTGLRVNEVLMLPEDCLVEKQYVDIVTGSAAGAIGGVSSAMGLRYFAEKHPDGRPGVLVEEVKWVPQRFETAIRDSIAMAQAASKASRQLLKAQLRRKETGDSDARKFATAEGRKLSTVNLLFLTLKGVWGEPKAPKQAVAVLGDNHVRHALGSSRAESVFDRYSARPAAGRLRIRPHALRHALTTEFFRLNVPDTVVTSYFGRQSVAQSYEYDHRSRFELLDAVELPEIANDVVEPGSPQELVTKMVVGGLAGRSHIAETFRKLQVEQGDRVAFEYLAANASGFHVTPYGLCVNSFSVDPCARHLKCFDNCKHFMASGRPEHRVSLETLRSNLRTMKERAEARPVTAPGRKNQMAHATQLLAGVERALAAQPNVPVFPDGEDHSAPPEDLFE